jgi:hypothetical protein
VVSFVLEKAECLSDCGAGHHAAVGQVLGQETGQGGKVLPVAKADPAQVRL